MNRSNRRHFAMGALSGGLSAVGLATVACYEARARNPYEPTLERVDLWVPAGHESLAGLTIGFVADTHIGPHVTLSDVLRAISLLSPSPGPDLVLLGGDYISASP